MGKQWRNEDIIFPEDAQRWEDGVEQSLIENDQNAEDLKKHAEDKNNPHGVTAAQAGAYTKAETDSRDAAILQTAKAHTDTHESRKNNPHGVTAAQTGAYTKAESNANDQEILTTAKQYTDEKKAEATTFTSQEVAKVKTEIQNGNVASATKLQASRKINGVDFDGTNDIAVVANPNQRTIAANTNLDDMVEPGFWTSHSDGNAGTLTNAPFGTSTFTLHIETGLNNTRIFQTAKSMFNGAVAVRHKREGVQWSEWTRLARADGTTQTGLFSEAANMLRTPRKIAGIDFDGTADIAIPAGNIGAYTKNESDNNISNEINKFGSSLSIDVRNLLLGTVEPLVIVGNNTLNQTGYRYTFTFGRLRDIPAKAGDPIAIAFDWEVTGTTVGGRFFPQFSDQPYNVAGRENIAISDSNRSGTSSFVTSVQSSWLETNATSAGIGIRADELRGTLTITNFRFLDASRDSGWLPATNEIALKSDLEMNMRNLVPNSSFYNDTHGWAVNGHLTATSTGAYTRFVKAAVTTARATISREVIDDRLKPGTEYTLGVMVYVESVTALVNTSGSTVFVRTNNGAMLDAPLGTIDWSKVGEWQLVSGTGTTRPSPWVNRPQITIAIGENTTCAIRIKELVIVEGNRYLGWLPAPEDKADQRGLEDVQQKVQTLEQNTIRITNQFSDHDFSKQLPRPVADGENMNIRYDNGDLVVENNHNALMQRFYWGSPPLTLSTGKAYNVAMYLNVGTVSNNKEFIVGTSNGENFTFSVEHSSPTWRQGTIGLTNWSAFSIWMPPGTALRIRELYIYEANTDITTARIERLEKDNSLPRVVPAFAAGFANYNTNPTSTNYCCVERDGDWVTLRGAITNTIVVPRDTTYVMCTLPVGYRPDLQERQLMQGSGAAKYLLHVETNGEVTVSRYSGHSQVGMHDAPIGAWLTTNIRFKVGG